ncbi:MAG: NUDIX hydrolase [Aestuariivita sp.]|nr:NUDIX hydrolase [Aestuariivita sp.]
MIHRIGEPRLKSKRYTRRPGAYALLPRDGNLLLTVQLCDEPDIQLPGGGIDTGEHAIVALHREVYEETGWRISKPRRIGAFRRFVYMPEYDLWAEKICHIFIARPTRQIGPPVETDHKVIWANPETAVRILGNAGDRYFASLLSF